MTRMKPKRGDADLSDSSTDYLDMPLLSRSDVEDRNPVFDLLSDSDSDEEQQEKWKAKESERERNGGPSQQLRTPRIACEACVAAGKECDELDECACCALRNVECIRDPNSNYRVIAAQLEKIASTQARLEVLFDTIIFAVDNKMTRTNITQSAHGPDPGPAVRSGDNLDGTQDSPNHTTGHSRANPDPAGSVDPRGYNTRNSSSTTANEATCRCESHPNCSPASASSNDIPAPNPWITRLPGEPSDADLRLAYREANYERRIYTHIPRHQLQHLLSFTNHFILQSTRGRRESAQRTEELAQDPDQVRYPLTTAAVEVEVRSGRRYGSTLKIHLDHDIGEMMTDIFGMTRVA